MLYTYRCLLFWCLLSILCAYKPVHASAFSVNRKEGGPAVVVRGHALYDPWETYNVNNYIKSSKASAAFINHVALFYSQKLPPPIPLMVNNFFENINDVGTAINELLQGKFKAFFSDFVRVTLNTVFGVLGMGNAAGVLGWSKNYQDFGLTLAHWGFPPGPYLFLPIIGPATVRSGLGILVDKIWDPISYLPWQVAVYALKGVNNLSNLLSAGGSDLFSTADKYVFVRSVYWQHTVYLIYAGDYSANAFSQEDLDEIIKNPL